MAATQAVPSSKWGGRQDKFEEASVRVGKYFWSYDRNLENKIAWRRRNLNTEKDNSELVFDCSISILYILKLWQRRDKE